MELGRLTQLEVDVEELAARVARLEGAPVRVRQDGESYAPPRAVDGQGWVEARPRRAPAAPAVAPAAAAPATPPPSLRERMGLDAGDPLEDLFGGRVLAWVGGLAVLLGLLFLLAIAISSGWLGEGARTALAGLASAGLLLGGTWLHERRMRADAARAATAAGLAGLFATLTVATRVYALLPVTAGLALALLVGALATALAIRWDSRGVAALGILGAVAAPLLVDAGYAPGTLALLFAALAAAAGVLLWRRWDWLGPIAFVLAAPQWISYLFDGATPLSATLTLVSFGALGVMLAVGHDVRMRASELRSQPALLLALNALVLAVAGWFAFEDLGDLTAGRAWLAALAVAHLAVGLGGRRLARVSHELQLFALALGIVLADVAFALTAHGWTLALGWSVAGVAFAVLQRRVGVRGRDGAFVQGGLGAHLALALVQALVVAEPVQALGDGAELSAAGAASITMLAAACLTAGRIVDARATTWRAVLDATGVAAVALLAALLLDGSALLLAWLGEGIVLAQIARRHKDRIAAGGALAFMALLALHALAFDAPPSSLASGLTAPRDAVEALGAVALLGLLAAAWLPQLAPQMRQELRASVAVTLLYLASVLVVTPFAGGEALDGALLDAQQQGQLALSVLWALVGLAALVTGLRRDERALRLGALALLGVTVAKVFLVDLATLTSVYRVGSFVALGLLLLAGAFAWQRLRPWTDERSEDGEVDLERRVDGEGGLQ